MVSLLTKLAIAENFRGSLNRYNTAFAFDHHQQQVNVFVRSPTSKHDTKTLKFSAIAAL